MEYQVHGKSVAIKLMLGRSAIIGRKIAVLDPERRVQKTNRNVRWEIYKYKTRLFIWNKYI